MSIEEITRLAESLLEALKEFEEALVTGLYDTGEVEARAKAFLAALQVTYGDEPASRGERDINGRR